MSAAEALRAARTFGLSLIVDGEDLVLEAAAPPPSEVLDLLSRQKADLIAILRPEGDSWSAEDWLAFYDERAGIAEFDGGLTHSEAEARAFTCCVAEWLNRHPVRSPPDHCLGCGGTERLGDPLSHFGTDAAGHAWLHPRCRGAWESKRRTAAAAALAAIAIREGNSTHD